MLEEKTMRLSQVARKLNVATTTITAYLLEKGFHLENKPNTKLTLEQHRVLVKEFTDAAMDKEAADLLIGKSYEKESKIVTHQNQLQADKPTQEPLSTSSTLIASQPNSQADQTETTFSQLTENREQEQGDLASKIQTELTATTKVPEKTIFKDQQVLKAVTVLGKITLAEKAVKKFQQVTSSDISKKNKKKPRKRVASTPSDTPAIPVPGKKQETIHRYKNKKTTIEPQKVALSEKEIQEQIRNTLAKLSGNRPTTNRAKYRREKKSLLAKGQAEERLQADQATKELKVTEFIAATDLASLMGVSVNELLSMCMNLGMLVSINQRLDAEAITIIADEFGYQVEFTDVKAQQLEEEETDPDSLVERAPIVTIMGHVDHGKTSLLDYIRNTQITKTEAGGITQHIGAYEVVMENGKHIAFLDTPGHEAFTAMRARGARLTDIAIIVVAADDGVKPQTKEAINHAKLAGLPTVIAINKIDKPEANPEKVKEGLAHLNILVEDWGGKYQSQCVSAITGEGVSGLLEKVLFEAELLELKANPHRKARGTVIEASLDQGRGYLVSMMVQEGTLRTGEVVLAGAYYGKIKAMFDYQGKILKEAGPSTPIQVLGLNGAPQAGDLFTAMNSEKDSKEIATHRQQILREQSFRTKTHITLDEIGRRLAIGNFKELNIILKGDVDGSVEALADSLLKLSTEEIKVKILHKGVGAIVESDILLAAASDAIIIGFQVRPATPTRKLAEKEGVEIRLYSIIYDAINDIKDAMQGMLAPTIEEVITGSAIVREIFKITGIGIIAGCYLTEGYIKKNNLIHVIRDGIVIYTGAIKHLKHFKEDMQQVKMGSECGISVSNFNEIKVNDIIEGFEQKSVERKL